MKAKRRISMRDYAHNDYEQFRKTEPFGIAFITGVIALLAFAVMVYGFYVFMDLLP